MFKMSSLPVLKHEFDDQTKTEEREVELKKSIHSNLRNLSKFQVTDILQNSTNRKAIFLKGIFEAEQGEAVVILEKTAFSEEHILNGSGDYFPGNNQLEKVFHNDIYGDYKYVTDSQLNGKYFYRTNEKLSLMIEYYTNKLTFSP